MPWETGGRWVVKPLRERGTAHVLETPADKNGYTLSLYVDAPEPSSAVLEFEVYGLITEPQQL